MESEKKQMEHKPTEKNKQSKLLYIILAVILVAVIAGIVFINLNGEKEPEKKQEEQAVKTEEETPEKPEEEPEKRDILAELGITVPEKNLDWQGLWAQNEDIYAWIYIPGTNIDYPVLQHPTDDVFYLDHNLDGSAGYPGCIYTEPSWNYKGFMDRNTVLYGHDLLDGTMFTQLHNFEDESFFNANRYAFIYTPEDVFVYDIFAAYEFTDEHILYTYNLGSDAGYQEYLDMVFATRDMGAHFRDGVQVGIQNKIITMSTCIAEKPNNRYLVQGVLLNDPDIENAGTEGE